MNTAQTNINGNYKFAEVTADFYNLTATKRGYWLDSDPVTATTGEPTTADIVLCRKGNLNTNCGQVDDDDLTLQENVSVGVAELE